MKCFFHWNGVVAKTIDPNATVLGLLRRFLFRSNNHLCHNCLQTIQRHGGHVFQFVGDAFHAAFLIPIQALELLWLRNAP